LDGGALKNRVVPPLIVERARRRLLFSSFCSLCSTRVRP
jgi:hypothetical protein